MKSFNGANFKLSLPKYVTVGNSVSFKTTFTFQEEPKPVLLDRAVLVNRFGESISTLVGLWLHPEKKTHLIQFSLEDKKSIYMTKAKLEMHFLRHTGDKIIVSYLFDMAQNSSLDDVKKMPASDTEKVSYLGGETLSPNLTNDDGDASIVQPQKLEPIHTDKSEIRETIKPYLDALNIEKKYLMSEGGRKYKVTNGRFIGRDNCRYTYAFDLETELHISDDAPITLSVGTEKTSGTVMLCEDFHIIVVVNSFMGQSVGTAYINVDPWKLLDALTERISYGLEVNCEMVRKLCEGAELATNRPIEEIAKGQMAVMEHALSKPVTIVWGPPGTGKTYTMASVAIELLNRNKSVLIVSHSNVSVDGIAKQMKAIITDRKRDNILKDGRILRYGYIRDEELRGDRYLNSFTYAANKDPGILSKLDSLQKEYEKIKATSGIASGKLTEIYKSIKQVRSLVRAEEGRCVQEAVVVATTISKATIDPIFQERLFDTVIFDEVSMAYVPQIISAATFSKEHLICVGDFMQLSPIVQSGADKLSEDVFDFLGINYHGKPYYHPWLIMLDEQRRMHPSISKFPSVRVYKKMLRDHDSVLTSREAIVKAELFPDNPINLVDLMSTYCASAKNVDNSRYNILSGILSFAMALKCKQNLDSVSIITPYAAQTRLVRALSLDYRKKDEDPIRCATVHQFQGSESDMIIFDAVESYPGKKPGWLMSKDLNSIKRLINVAVTRARGKLAVVANARFWEDNYKQNPNHMFYQLIKYLELKGNVIRYKDSRALPQMITELSTDRGPKFYVDNRYMDSLLKDIDKAKGRIIVSVPSSTIDTTVEKELLNKLMEAKKKGVEVFVKCKKTDGLPAGWKSIAGNVPNVTFPIVMIDDKITWYGVPFADWKFVLGNTTLGSPCKIACRIRGEHTAEIIRSFTEIDQIAPIDGDEGRTGLVRYASKLQKCSGCGDYMIMSKGKSGKWILYCRACNKTELLSPDDVNSYIYKNGVKCKEHHTDIEARVGRYGLYIKCDCGHYIKPENI